MKKIFFFFGVMMSFAAFSQSSEEDIPLDSLKMYETDPVPVYTKAYMRQYNHYKRLILKVYPYALYASDVLYQLEADSEEITKDRKRKKFYKSAYKELKLDFKYVFMDMYTSEGRMLMKLVHRETGLTIFEIAETYRGKKNAMLFDIMGKIWDQDVRIKWEPQGKDKVGEHVIRDIEAGTISFNSKVVRVDKAQYKDNRKQHKKRLRENKKRRKQNEKECKKKERKKARDKRRKNRRNKN